MSEFRFLILTPRYDETVAFYGERLGYPVYRSWDDGGRGTIFRAGSGFVEVLEEGGAPPPAGVALALEVEDATAWHATLTGRGVGVTGALGERPWGHRSFTVEDPNGLAITFFEELWPEGGEAP